MSDKTCWTPGPWVIDPATRPAEICTIHGLPKDQTEGQGWAYVRGALGHWDADEDEEMANAHLIAASPDLYEALTNTIQFAEACHRQCSDELMRQAIGADIAKAHAALSKARGES